MRALSRLSASDRMGEGVRSDFALFTSEGVSVGAIDEPDCSSAVIGLSGAMSSSRLELGVLARLGAADDEGREAFDRRDLDRGFSSENASVGLYTVGFVAAAVTAAEGVAGDRHELNLLPVVFSGDAGGGGVGVDTGEANGDGASRFELELLNTEVGFDGEGVEDWLERYAGDEVGVSGGLR